MTVELDRIRRRCNNVTDDAIAICADPRAMSYTAHADRCRLLELVDDLTKQCDFYEAMKTGLTQRIEDLERDAVGESMQEIENHFSGLKKERGGGS